MKTKYVQFIDGYLVDMHQETIASGLSLETAKEVAKRNNFVLLDEDMVEVC